MTVVVIILVVGAVLMLLCVTTLLVTVLVLRKRRGPGGRTAGVPAYPPPLGGVPAPPVDRTSPHEQTAPGSGQ
jgi:hypothetical protein